MGEPVWYKAEPRVVPPREQTEVVLWLRRPPQDAFKLEITTDAGQQETEVIPMRPACDIEAIDFADGRREIFYLRAALARSCRHRGSHSR